MDFCKPAKGSVGTPGGHSHVRPKPSAPTSPLVTKPPPYTPYTPHPKTTTAGTLGDDCRLDFDMACELVPCTGPTDPCCTAGCWLACLE